MVSVGPNICEIFNISENDPSCREYKDAFVGVAEELCGRTSGKGGTPRSRNQGWWMEEVAKAVWKKREAWKMIESFSDRGEQPPTGSGTCMARIRRQPGVWWTEHGGVWRKNCSESLAKMVAKR